MGGQPTRRDVLRRQGESVCAHYGMRQVQVLDPQGKLIRQYPGGNRQTSNVALAVRSEINSSSPEASTPTANPAPSSDWTSVSKAAKSFPKNSRGIGFQPVSPIVA